MVQSSITREIRYCTVRIETNTGTGTGFIYDAGIPGSQSVPLVVTNKHVIADSSTGRLRLIRERDGAPTAEPVNIALGPAPFASMWHGHPDPDVDVAVMLFAEAWDQLGAADHKPFFRSITPDLCPTPEQLADLDAIETVTFVGYPNGLIDTVNHTPIVRQGITSTPIADNWCGKPQFLIDASVFPGSSGSPVFLIIQGPRETPNGGTITIRPVARFHFIGIVAAAHIQPDTGKILRTTSGLHIGVKQFIDLGIVYKWTAIEETVDSLFKALGVRRPSGLFQQLSIQ
jgi:hypothetical protein